MRHLIDTYQSVYTIKRFAFADDLKQELYDALSNQYNPYWDVAPFNFLLLPHTPEAYGGLVTSDIPLGDKIAWVNEHRTELRPVLQHYGTEYRRAQSPFYWVKCLSDRISAEDPQIALVSDVRFKSEFFYIKSVGGYVTRITRYGYTDPNCDPNHVSETELDKVPFDFEINVLDGEVDQLRKDAVTVFELVKQLVDPITEEDVYAAGADEETTL